MKTTNQKRSFTLIELLIVIAIIAILASMLMPALNKARARATEVSCAGNQRQIASFLTLYVNDYGDTLPLGRKQCGINHGSTPHINDFWPNPPCWFETTCGIYSKKNYKLFVCATYQPMGKFAPGWNTDFWREAELTYGYNCNGSGQKLARCKSPARTYVIGEFWKGNFGVTGYGMYENSTIWDFAALHNRKCNLAFYDGHVRGGVDILLYPATTDEFSANFK